MVDKVYRDLVNESDKLNNSQGSFYDLRSRSTFSRWFEKNDSKMILSKLIDKGSVVRAQKDRNIKDEEKSRLSNVCAFAPGQGLVKVYLIIITSMCPTLLVVFPWMSVMCFQSIDQSIQKWEICTLLNFLRRY